jgi:hypothetical protein
LVGLVIALRPQTPKHIRFGWSHYSDTANQLMPIPRQTKLFKRNKIIVFELPSVCGSSVLVIR